MDPVKPDDRGALENADQNVDDVFDEAFDKAAEVEEGKADPAAIPDVAAKEDPPPPAKPDEAAAAAAAAKEDEKAEQRYSTLQGMYKKDRETWETDRANLLAQVEEAKKAAAPKKETEIPKDLEDALSDEDKEALREYDEEFDLVSKMEGKKRDIALKVLRKEVKGYVDNLKAELTAQLAPTQNFIKDTVEEREINSELNHFSSIKEAHSDFEKYRDDGSIMKWIGTKPKYMQKGMVEAYNQGTADEVVDLLTDFKTDNNISSGPPARENVVRMDKKAEKKLAMTAVTTRRGAVNPSFAVATDFDGAFDEALKKQGG